MSPNRHSMIPFPVPFYPFMNETVSPLGGAGVTTAVKVTACSIRDGFGEEVSTVVVTRADGLSSNATPQPLVPGQ